MTGGVGIGEGDERIECDRKEIYQFFHQQSQFWHQRFALWILFKKLL